MQTEVWTAAENAQARRQLDLNAEWAIAMVSNEAHYAGDLNVSEVAEMLGPSATPEECLRELKSLVARVKLPSGWAVVALEHSATGERRFGLVDFTSMWAT